MVHAAQTKCRADAPWSLLVTAQFTNYCNLRRWARRARSKAMQAPSPFFFCQTTGLDWPELVLTRSHRS